MKPLRFPWEDGADLIGAEGDHQVDLAGGDVVYRLGPVFRDINIDLFQQFDGLWTYFGWRTSSAEDFDLRTRHLPGQAFGQLAASRVGHAHEEQLHD